MHPVTRSSYCSSTFYRASPVWSDRKFLLNVQLPKHSSVLHKGAQFSLTANLLLFFYASYVTSKCATTLWIPTRGKTEEGRLSLTFCSHCVLFSIVLSRCCSFRADHSPSIGGESLCTTLAPRRETPNCSVCDGDPPLWHPSSSGRMKV